MKKKWVPYIFDKTVYSMTVYQDADDDISTELTRAGRSLRL